MTDRENPPRRRLADMGRAGMVLAWWHRYRDPIMGTWLIAVSLAVIFIAFEVRANSADRARDAAVVRVITEQQAKNAQATAAAARQSCERTREFAPRLIDDYERRGVFPKRVLDEYRRSIPKTCPK